jgi:Na+/H+ antiporter NhaD/arsenite permease-like protein
MFRPAGGSDLNLDWIVVATFAAVYVGMALGRWPGLAIDRTGVALIGAIFLLLIGAVGAGDALVAIDFPTLAILFALMVLSAQFAASGFFEWCSAMIAGAEAGPRGLLLMVVVTAGGLAAVLTNDVVVWAMTPIIVRGMIGRGLDPRPFVIALAAAANAGSAATIIGNPQNLLISQVGRLEFWPFAIICAGPAVIGLAVVYAVTAWTWRDGFAAMKAVREPMPVPGLDRPALVKAVSAAAAVIAAFTFAPDPVPWALAVAGVLLLSRRHSTRRMMSMVDWHLLLLFAALFLVTGALSGTQSAARALAWLGGLGFDLRNLGSLLFVSLAGSNTIGNVPLVTLLLSLWGDLGPGPYVALALFSTLSGNFLIVGSIANIIAVERAGREGVTVGFADYARIGVPATLLSLAASYLWLSLAIPTSIPS